MIFKKVDAKASFPKMEEEILKFWDEQKIFEKSVANREGAKKYSFYDGPPFATGTPHYGHIVASAIKDTVPRYFTMKGFQVERKWGWDCHGLPIENIAEKELGITHKKEIESLGVEKFNEICRSKVLEYVSEWKKVIGRFGRWADMDNAYKTMDRDYMESVWWVFKELWDKGLVYESYRTMHICPRCETTLSQSEVAEGYADVKDLSVVAKFELTDEPGTFVLAWTTTPWTLPGNVALAVGKGIEYVKVVSDGVRYIVAKDLMEQAFVGKEFQIEEEIIGNELVGRSYKPLFDYYLDTNEDLLRKRKVDNGEKDVVVLAVFNEKGEVLLGYRNYTKDTSVDRDFWIAPGGKAEIGETMEEAIRRELKEECNIENYKIKKYLGSYRGYSKDHNLFCYLLEIGNIDQIQNNEPEKFQEWKFFSSDTLPVSEFPNTEDDRKFFLGALHWHNAYKIYAADFVTTEDGTGVVHIAPAFGEDDMALGKQENLPFVQHVKMDGTMKDEVTDFAGMSVKPKENPQAMDVEIIKYLAHNGLLFSKEKYEHSYPHCWRCDTPLLNYATSSWFVSVTKMKDRALELAKNINWSPAHIKEGRFGKWLEGARDWSISRQRYWASVMPIWKCECGEMKVFGSAQELEEASGEKIADLHKHIVDKIVVPCVKCSGQMKRIPDVLDTWFDSGSMPYAQMHYPFENKEKFEESFPADFIAEGVDQTRAWFYYQHIIGTGIKDSNAFRNVIVNGIVQGEDGKKMSKKLKNYPDPMEVIEKHGADALRFYLLSSPIVAAENLNFSERDLADVSRNAFRMLWNSYSFFTTYASIDKWVPIRNATQSVAGGPKKDATASENILDRWILSELQLLIREVDGAMGRYELSKATRAFTPFIDNLSNWYIRRSRKRFWKPARHMEGGSEDDSDKENAYQTLYDVLVTLAKVMAPFTPFLSEEIYRNLVGSANHPERVIESKDLESVHLADWPAVKEESIDEKLNEEMRSVRNLVTEGLKLRADAKIKVRQPLGESRIKNQELSNESLEILKEELNVKNIISDASLEGEITFDTEITESLKLEGEAREIIRAIQEGRKKAGFSVEDRIALGYSGKEKVFESAELKGMIQKEILATSVQKGDLADAEHIETAQIEGASFIFSLKRI